MGVVKNLMVRAGADFSAITKQANKAKSSMKGMHTSISKSCSGITAAASKMGKMLGAIGVGLSVTAVVSAAKNAKAAYDEQAEASAKLAQVMRNTMGARSEEIKSIEEYIDSLERVGVVTGEVQTAGAQELATYLQLSDSLKTLIPVMNDMVAQQYGIGASAESAVSIATMLGKVMNGQTSALSRYGYSFTAAQEAVLKYGTEAQRAAVLAEVVGESVGGMNAALAATPNGRLQQVSNTLGRIKESFGQAVNQILVLFIPVLNVLCGVLERVAALANKVAQSLANVFGSSSSTASSAASSASSVVSVLGDVEESATSAGKAMGLLGFDQITKLNEPSSSSESAAADTSVGGIEVSGVVTGVEEAGESIGWLESKLSALKAKFSLISTDNLVSAFGRLRDAVSPFGEKLFSGLSWAMDNILVPLTGWVIEDALPAFLDTLSSGFGLLNVVLDGLAPVGIWLWEEFLQPLAGWTGTSIVAALQLVGTVIDWLTGILRGLLDFVTGVFTGDMGKAIRGIEQIFSGLGDAVDWVILSIQLTFFSLLDWLDKVTGGTLAPIIDLIKGWFSGVCDEVRSAFSGVYDGVKQILSGLLLFVSGVFAGEWSRAWEGVKTVFTGIWNGVVSVLESAINLIIRGVNWLIQMLNRVRFTVPEWVPGVGGKSIGINIPYINTVSLPRLATGTVVDPNHEFAAILGDNKHEQEIVSPVSTMKRAFRDVLLQMDSKSASESVVSAIYAAAREVVETIKHKSGDVNLNGKKVGELTTEEQNRRTRMYGKQLQYT